MTVAALLAAATLASCAPAPEPTLDILEESRAYFAQLATEAEEAGASDDQVTALRRAAESGELTNQDVIALYEPFFDCVADVGAEGEVFGTEVIAPGYTVPDYRVKLPDPHQVEDFDAILGLVKACEDRYVGFAFKAIQLQPAVQAAKDADLLAHRDEVIACLAAAGEKVAADATADELASAVIAAKAADGVECYDLSGGAG